MNEIAESTPPREEKPKWWLKTHQRRYILSVVIFGFFICTWLMTTIALVGLFVRLCYEVWPTKAFMETCFTAGMVWVLCLVVLHATVISVLGTTVFVLFDQMCEGIFKKLGLNDEDFKL